MNIVEDIEEYEIVFEHKAGRSTFAELYGVIEDHSIIHGEDKEGVYYEVGLEEVTRVYKKTDQSFEVIWEGEGMMIAES